MMEIEPGFSRSKLGGKIKTVLTLVASLSEMIDELIGRCIMRLSSFFYLILLVSCLLIPVQQSHAFFFDFDFSADDDYYGWDSPYYYSRYQPYYGSNYNSYYRYRYNPYWNRWNQSNYNQWSEPYQSPYDCTCTCAKQQSDNLATETVAETAGISKAE
ncbi:MAG: hypothetical protein KZQ64_02470 [gamma proteobacterium symbiont of Bathyaustriella thionipta]|nr:hypothetical protein [gamma proteobacterium symbiont of Bathyaustriella thionipta]MCU7951234.1 hypothetical protein [gamma proteobacterium symbiont of Bathyaustriella thionipta]MCU7952254.1 hypothetical protein [gamma proteobacterium symbiont of Bathyaustriella thionipta]MCU7957947.1 hypothetical protein [gamma proteobacterium symbiont of Bathyaustriella thionipta]MCU7969007.1 hypothetical protein [gamma proteobacterium symbiont of Bathyaustriella thionipta]